MTDKDGYCLHCRVGEFINQESANPDMPEGYDIPTALIQVLADCTAMYLYDTNQTGKDAAFDEVKRMAVLFAELTRDRLREYIEHPPPPTDEDLH